MTIVEQRTKNIVGWSVFLIGFIVYYLTAERAGSLWDCGEFIAGAYKLEVVHPPGAPLFIIMARIFAFLGDSISSNPQVIAFAVNLFSGVATAMAATLFSWITMRLLEHIYSERKGGNKIAIIGAAIVTGLCIIFSSSVWFSAVEGEVYALSLFFTALTFWCVVKWYTLPENPNNDRWLVMALYSAGLSIGVHLLSLLTLPVLAMFYSYKKNKNPSIFKIGLFSIAGLIIIGIVQKLIIVGIPQLWQFFELFAVNKLGLPFHSGLVFALGIIVAIFIFGFRYAKSTGKGGLQMILTSMLMIIIGYSTIIIVVIRANAEPPINMNDNYDVTRLIPYINREQYGERPILNGPQFDINPVSTKLTDRYGRVGDKYEIIDQKYEYEYRDIDKTFFPRMASTQSKDTEVYRGLWMKNPQGSPTSADNMNFFFKYQIGWMYFRYMFWNFIGRQNFEQGHFYFDKSKGNWMSGIKPWDEARLYNMDNEPDIMKNDKSRNKYFAIPFILGILGIIFHFKHRREDAFAVLGFFIITGFGIIIYSNQPPIEPRERDYVLAASFATFCIWIGMAVPFLFEVFKKYIKGQTSAYISLGLCLTAPILMGTQNWDDHTRRHLKGATDYGSNFLKSCKEDAILFTYGDNDTYPVWYVQEVENIRTDIRVVNLSLIGIDYYVNAQRKKKNQADPVEFTISKEGYRGENRNYVYIQDGPPMSLQSALKFLSESHPRTMSDGTKIETYLPSRTLYLDVSRTPFSGIPESARNKEDLTERITFSIPKNKNVLYKGDIALLDIIGSNFGKRPIYFANTAGSEKKFGAQEYFQMEGLASQLVPVDPYIIGNSNELIAVQIAYDNIMNEFKWGNFDKYEMYVEHSFDPSRYAMTNLFLKLSARCADISIIANSTADSLSAVDNANSVKIDSLRNIAQKHKEMAVTLSTKYFDVFPYRNFGYMTGFTDNFVNILITMEAYDEAKPLLMSMAEDVRQHMIFYNSLKDEVLSSSFSQNYQTYSSSVSNLLRFSQKFPDTTVQTEITNKIGEFMNAPQVRPEG